MAKEKSVEISVTKIDRMKVNYFLLGTSPLIYNAMSNKVIRGLLLPPGRKNRAELEANLKHEPLQEFRNSVYFSKNPKSPTFLEMPAVCFKASLCSAALDIPGANKAQLGRLTYVEGDRISIYGIPQLKMDVVRMADIARTPDVRTRACLPQWACAITVSFITPLLREPTVSTLLSAAGVMQGVGDYRPQKGKGNFGCFELVTADHPAFVKILKEGGRGPQSVAMKSPEFYDSESEALYRWHEEETKRRGFKVAA